MTAAGPRCPLCQHAPHGDAVCRRCDDSAQVGVYAPCTDNTRSPRTVAERERVARHFADRSSPLIDEITGGILERRTGPDRRSRPTFPVARAMLEAERDRLQGSHVGRRAGDRTICPGCLRLWFVLDELRRMA